MAGQLSKAKLEANRANSVSSTGPTNTNSTRFNAVKHGLLAEGITELDDLDYKYLLTKVKDSLKPDGPIEHFLAEQICLGLIRLRRARRLEAEFITGELNPAITRVEGGLHQHLEDLAGKTVVIDPGIPARLSTTALDSLVGKFQRYETAIENKFYRAMNQLERLQRMRQGENLPAPATLDVGLHTDKQPLASFGNPLEGQPA